MRDKDETQPIIVVDKSTFRAIQCEGRASLSDGNGERLDLPSVNVPIKWVAIIVSVVIGQTAAVMMAWSDLSTAIDDLNRDRWTGTATVEVFAETAAQNAGSGLWWPRQADVVRIQRRRGEGQ